MENEEKNNEPQGMGVENLPADNVNSAENAGNNDGAEKVQNSSADNFSNAASSLEVSAGQDDLSDAAEKYVNFAEEERVEADNSSAGESRNSIGSLAAPSSKEKIAGMLAGNKKKIAIAAGAIVFLAIIAVAVGYFLKGKNNVDTPSGGDDTVIESSFAAMKGVDSYTYDGKIKFAYAVKEESSEAYDADFEASYKGVFEKTGEEKEGRAFYSDIAYNSTINVGEKKNETNFDVESASINNKEYLRLNGFGIKGTGADAKTAELENSMKSYENSWYTVSSDDSRKFFGKIADYISLPASIGSASEINAKNAEYFDGIFSNPGILNISGRLGEEESGGVDAVHYGVDLNSQEALKVAARLMKIQAEQGGLDEDAKKILEELENNADNAGKLKETADQLLSGMDFEIWIGKSDNLVHRFKISGSFDKDFAKRFMSKIKDLYGDAYSADAENIPDMNLEFEFDYTMSKFNDSEVREPSDAKDFKEVMDKLEAIGAVSATVPVSAAADADGDGLSDEEEKKYGSDPAKTDTDGDGYKDGEEIRNGYDPIVAGSARLDYNKLPQGK